MAVSVLLARADGYQGKSGRCQQDRFMLSNVLLSLCLASAPRVRACLRYGQTRQTWASPRPTPSPPLPPPGMATVCVWRPSLGLLMQQSFAMCFSSVPSNLSTSAFTQGWLHLVSPDRVSTNFLRLCGSQTKWHKKGGQPIKEQTRKHLPKFMIYQCQTSSLVTTAVPLAASDSPHSTSCLLNLLHGSFSCSPTSCLLTSTSNPLSAK